MSDDSNAQLERHYRETWMCSECGSRHPMTANVCDLCMDRALKADKKKLRDLGAQA